MEDRGGRGIRDGGNKAPDPPGFDVALEMRYSQFSSRPRLPKSPTDSWFYIGSVTQQRIASSANMAVFAKICSSFLVVRVLLPGRFCK